MCRRELEKEIEKFERHRETERGEREKKGERWRK